MDKVKRIKGNVMEIVCNAATLVSPKLNTRIRYYLAFKKRLDLKHPKTLNEKVLWLKLNKYMTDPLVIQCADKYRVREYVKESGCEDILIPLIGAWNNAADIPWNELPNEFVIKWNFGCGMNIICTDKSRLDRSKIVKQLSEWGKCKYWLSYSEMQYKYAPKMIVCEQLLCEKKSIKTSENWIAPKDYKVYCFNGKPKYIMVCVGREKEGHPKFYYFDDNWELARISNDSKNAPANFSIEKPECFEKLLECSKRLSEPFPFVRADFYVVGPQLFFGELTFTPAGGLDSRRLPETDIMMGNLLNLNTK